jgi:glucosamine-6-phosphate deaminase
MSEHFWDPLSQINPSFNKYQQAIIPDGSAKNVEEECKRYEKAIADLGGIDLQIVGIGTNGHIGFNEPGSPGDSKTRLVNLAEETIQVNKAHFGGDAAKVPVQAFTMGIGTIMSAREIVLIAAGKSKAPIMAQMQKLEEPTIDIPASFLIKHSNCSFFADQDASSQLEYSALKASFKRPK